MKEKQKIAIEMCLDELVYILDVYGEDYLLDCVNAELLAYEFTKDLKALLSSIRIAVVVAIHRVSGDLRDSLWSDVPNRVVCSDLRKRLSMLLALL